MKLTPTRVVRHHRAKTFENSIQWSFQMPTNISFGLNNFALIFYVRWNLWHYFFKLIMSSVFWMVVTDPRLPFFKRLVLFWRFGAFWISFRRVSVDCLHWWVRYPGQGSTIIHEVIFNNFLLQFWLIFYSSIVHASTILFAFVFLELYVKKHKT